MSRAGLRARVMTPVRRNSAMALASRPHSSRSTSSVCSPRPGGAGQRAQRRALVAHRAVGQAHRARFGLHLGQEPRSCRCGSSSTSITSFSGAAGTWCSSHTRTHLLPRARARPLGNDRASRRRSARCGRARSAATRPPPDPAAPSPRTASTNARRSRTRPRSSRPWSRRCRTARNCPPRAGCRCARGTALLV